MVDRGFQTLAFLHGLKTVHYLYPILHIERVQKTLLVTKIEMGIYDKYGISLLSSKTIKVKMHGFSVPDTVNKVI